MPHAFGLSRPTIIDHRKLVKNKIGAPPPSSLGQTTKNKNTSADSGARNMTEMLNTLSEMQLAIKLLREVPPAGSN